MSMGGIPDLTMWGIAERYGADKGKRVRLTQTLDQIECRFAGARQSSDGCRDEVRFALFVSYIRWSIEDINEAARLMKELGMEVLQEDINLAIYSKPGEQPWCTGQKQEVRG